MSAKPARVPGPDHPITIDKSAERVRVTVAGKTIADSADALVLREASYPPVFYIPRKDVDMTLLERTTHTSHCPYKGDASYYSIVPGCEKSVNAIWSYETPNPAVAQIKEHVAFYPNRVDSIETVD